MMCRGGLGRIIRYAQCQNRAGIEIWVAIIVQMLHKFIQYFRCDTIC